MSDHRITELEPIETTTKLDIHERLPKKIFPKVFSFAALVNENKCLKKLIALQVDLSVVQKRKGIAKYLVACDFEKHIAPHVLFLARLDVENIGQYLTKNMDIVLIDLAELENRLNYLKSKGFESKDVSRIISNSRILLMDVESVDEKLGHLQKMFSLSGKEVREVLTKTPKLMNKPHMLQLIKENKFHCKEFLGFSHMELKTILLDYPGFFMKSPSHLSKIFDYLHNTMEIDHKTIVKNCHVFKSRLRFIQNRHLYLLKVNRAQYDPQRENFVSFNALVSGTNEEFCANVAKTSLKDYYRFQESL
ncbi:hypothetical protein LOTGIDRAFT_202320 [Lottia gigantea]|uniref:Uncharacterized protein n=1 Tax=Lottia gigantea TaxID=225164 RepID=V4APR9_LOTGI|nr:hypothetical protein LOTGIDRAFT_202320 [Lottia gigantea]ESO95631.1 hypothetical protein LOTGIDRAFT_202320 [Lottia gigantea]